MEAIEQEMVEPHKMMGNVVKQRKSRQMMMVMMMILMVMVTALIACSKRKSDKKVPKFWIKK